MEGELPIQLNIQHIRLRMDLSRKSCRLNRTFISLEKRTSRKGHVPRLAYSFENELGWKNELDIEVMDSIGRSAFGEVTKIS